MSKAAAFLIAITALVASGCKGDPVPPDPTEDVSMRVDVVYCGDDVCDLEEGELCCFKSNERDHCDMSCSKQALECDGPEDCMAGEICCGDDPDRAKCEESCGLPVCHDHNDCKDFKKATKCYESVFTDMNFCKKP